MAERTESLYARRQKIHAREVDGVFNLLRALSVVVLLGLYYLLPWIPWGDRQGLLFDLPARKFYLFGLTLWPQDFIYLAWLLIMAALLLFFVTTLAGRLWCGYACPQTVWSEAFMWLERLTEGTFLRRIKLDRAPASPEKFLRKGAKGVLWLAFAAWTGFTFVGYFTPIHELGARVWAFDLGPWETFWICFYSLATYGNAGHLREQVCIYMCPYARFQSAMIDRDTLIVSYDAARGEPRGGRKRGTDSSGVGLGDCVDCHICVQACPTGIDIRNGLQYECIACASCIDACNGVMDRMGYRRGLIRYTTQNALAGKPVRLMRGRTIFYGSVLIILFTATVISLANRSSLHLDVIRDRNFMYREVAGDTIENVYTLKVLNKSPQTRKLVVSVAGIPQAHIETVPAQPVLEGGSIASIAVRVDVPREQASPGGHDIVFSIRSEQDQTVQAARKARFIMPLRRDGV